MSLASSFKSGIQSAGLWVAKLAGYQAADQPTATTRQGTMCGTNPNSTTAQIQRVAMNWTAEDVFKNSCLGAAYISQRVNYCSSMMVYIPATGDPGLDEEIKQYLYGSDGYGGVFSTMGVDCSMQDAFSRTADIETPVRGDAGLIFWRDARENLRLIEFSADQLGLVYDFSVPRKCSLTRTKDGTIVETSGQDCTYLAGRYFRGADCIAYKIYERTNSYYGNPRIYDSNDVIYFRDPASFRGVRGVTKFATAILHMQKGERLFQIGMDAALRQAKTAMMVYNNSGAPQDWTYSQQGADGQVKYVERLMDGPLVEYFYSGDQAAFASPDSPGPELIQGVETSDERVALALGMNYAFLISATKVGGAPSRLEIEKADKELSRIKNTIHRPRLSRVRDTVLLKAADDGDLPYHPKLLSGRWQLPISPSVDAFYDAKENIAMIRGGFEAPQDIIAETNRDADDVIQKKKQWAVKCAMAVEDGNDELTALGYKPTLTIADIAQVSDNPLQTTESQSLEEGKVQVTPAGHISDQQTHHA